MSKKNRFNNQGQPGTISTSTHVNAVVDEKFSKTKKVLVTGTSDKRFSMSPDKQYEVTESMAQALIGKGAAVLVKTPKEENE